MKIKIIRILVMVFTLAAIGYMSIKAQAASSGTWSTDEQQDEAEKEKGGCCG